MKNKDDIWALAVLFVIVVALLVVLFPPAVQASGYEHDLDEQTRIPRLVGYGCKGSSGPLFANEEDHFPKCIRIEAWR